MAGEDKICGLGNPNAPKPGDPSNNATLVATPAFGGIDLNFTYPTLNPHAVAYTDIFRGTSEDFNSALYIAKEGGTFYYDRLSNTNTYFYWIRFVSINGTVGELIGPASATARPMINQVLEMLTAQIDAGALAQSLKNDLNQISVLNANLLDEITARENSHVTLAQALNDVDAGVAQAMNFIAEEANSRATADSAMAEQVNVMASTLNDQIAAVVQTTSTEIDAINNTISAMYTVQLTANGLVGGFGLINNGASVEAGFDVDTFWVGRTNADKIKPFIISGGEVFINEAVIQSLIFSKLRSDDGALIVENGKIKADYLTVNQLETTSAQSTNYVAGQSGWSLNADGTLEINKASVGVGRTQIDGQSVRVYDNNGVLRVRLGIW